MTQGFSDPYRKPLNGLNSICREYLSTVTPGGSEGKECLQCGRPEINPWVGKIPRRRKWQPTPLLLPGESHGGRSLVGYSPWGRKELDTTERLHFTLGKIPWNRNDHPLWYSCLENRMDRGTWWTTVHGVAESQT